MERRVPDQQVGYPRPSAGVTILHFGIACCALTMAIVVAVAVIALS